MTIRFFLDTSGEQAFLALERGEEVLVRLVPAGRSGGNALLKAIDALFEEFSITLKDLSAYVLGVGPGSFTGVRVGVSIIQGFHLVHKAPIYTLPSPYFYAPSEQYQGYFYSLLNARGGDVFYAKGSSNSLGIEWEDPQFGSLEELDPELPCVSPDNSSLKERECTPCGLHLRAPKNILRSKESDSIPLSLLYLRQPYGA